MQTSNSRTVSVDIDELVAGKRASKMNRVLMPLLIAHVIAVLVAGIAMYFYVQNNRANSAKVEAARDAITQTSDAPPVDMSKVIRTAGVRVHNALGTSSMNNITLTSDVEGATLWLDDEKIGALPVHNLVTRSEEHTSELQSRGQLVCRLLLEKKKRTV